VAEILIQRKRRRSVWPWLLGLLVLALLPLPFLVNRGDRPVAPVALAGPDTTTRTDTSAVRDTSSGQPAGATAVATAPPGERTIAAAAGERTTATAAGTIGSPDSATPAAGAPPASARAVPSGRGSFADFLSATAPPSSEREYRAYTADALRRLADDLRARGATEAGVATIRVHADSLEMPTARRNARPDYARAAFLAAIHEIDLLRTRHGARVNMERLRSRAWAIDPRRTLAGQRNSVTRFFQSARDAVDSFSRSG
jgi:hypothetical protein